MKADPHKLLGRVTSGERFDAQLRDRLRSLVDKELIAEHEQAPLGPHGDRLARVLTYMRRQANVGKYVVLSFEDSSQWRLARITADRSSGSVQLENEAFSRLEDALHGVFIRRATELMGPPSA